MLGRPNTALSQIHMQIMWSRLIAVVEEQAQTLVRTAFSTPVREAGDLSAGVFDRDGNMLAQAVTGTPGHVNSMAASSISMSPIQVLGHGYSASMPKTADAEITASARPPTIAFCKLVKRPRSCATRSRKALIQSNSAERRRTAKRSLALPSATWRSGI